MRRDRCPACGDGFIYVADNTLDRIALRILVNVAERYNVAMSDIIGKSREKQIATARHEAAGLMRDAGFLLKEIGHHLGDRHYSTIHHSLLLIEGRPRARKAIA
jgi:chromosomal replication initiation ATPase DnaA